MIKKTKILFFLFLFPAVTGLLGCSMFSERGHRGEPTTKRSTSNNPCELADEYRKKHKEYLGKAVQQYRYALENPETADLARFELGVLFYERGDFEKAVQHLETLKNNVQNSALASRILGLSHFRLHRYPRALHHLRRAHELNSKDGEVLYYLGLIYEDKNLAEEAEECFRNAIKASPRTDWAEQAKAHLETLETRDSGTTISQIEDDEVRRLILKAAGQEDYPDAGAIVLLDQEKLTIHINKTQTREIHKIIKILNDRGKDRAEVEISFNSPNETVHIDLARTIRPDGKIVNVGGEAMRNLTPWGGFPLYSNAQVRVISMPEVIDGAIIEYKATVSSSRLSFEDYFTDSFGFQDYEPTMVSRYILEVPEGLRFKTHFLHTEPIQPRIERLSEQSQSGDWLSRVGYIDRQRREKDILRYTWEMRDVPPIKSEWRMPGWADIVPMILVSSFPDWESFSRWWWEMAKERIETDEAIREKVLELTVGQKTPEEKARAIYHYVTSEIRYVGLEYGKGAFRPHHASEVFANKYGDCKDQAILLVAMLREAGISAYPALIGTRGDKWELQRSIPMSQFNHAIVLAEIEGEQVWFDPTAWLSPFGELPGYDQGREVLVFFEDEGRFLKTPVLPLEKNKKIQEIEIGISTDGAMSVKAKVTVCGWFAQGIRHLLKSKNPQGRIDEVKDLVNGYCPGAILESCSFSRLDDLSLPLIIEYRLSAPDYIKRAGDLLLFRLPWLFSEVNGVGKDRRTHPMTWPSTQSAEIRISIQIPQGYRVQSIPESFELNLPFAYYGLEYKNTGERILVLSFGERRTLTIGVDEYPDYKKYKESIAKEVDRPIIFERTGSS